MGCPHPTRALLLTTRAPLPHPHTHPTQPTHSTPHRLINGLLAAGKEAGHAICGGHISGACVGVVWCGVFARQ
jgi:hypothetical protein